MIKRHSVSKHLHLHPKALEIWERGGDANLCKVSLPSFLSQLLSRLDTQFLRYERLLFFHLFKVYDNLENVCVRQLLNKNLSRIHLNPVDRNRFS